MHAALKYAVALGTCAALVITIASAADPAPKPAQDKYTVKVPGGLAFSEFKGYERWELISVSHNGPALAAIMGNPTMIAAYKSGIPGNGKPFPDGSKMTKVHWIPKKNDAQPGGPLQPDFQKDVDFMVKDSKRFADSGGWGYGAFKYDPATKTFAPAGLDAMPPQGNDAKCGAACHTIARANDYVFSEYAPR